MANDEEARLRQGAAVWNKMANDEEARLRQGATVWNDWRAQNRGRRVDLHEASLHEASLSGADLREADLREADLREADLREADLREADLREADLRGADLRRANLGAANLFQALLGEANLFQALLREANLHEASLSGADLSWASLGGANLRGASLHEANLGAAKLGDADLHGASLVRAKLGDADLHGAKLGDADLHGANPRGANLREADLDGAKLYETVFADVDLSTVKGLDSCSHLGPSILDHRTLQRSGRLPLPFLRGCGLPDRLIDYLPSLLEEAIHYYSCFISYSSKDDAFAKRLHADLQNTGVRCWFAPHDLPIGAKTWDAIDAAIRVRDKLLLILSKSAIASDWVEDEVSKAFAEERRRKRVVLFPVRIDDTVVKTSESWAVKLRDQRNIGDFRKWKDHDAYQQAFELVLRDLKQTPG